MGLVLLIDRPGYRLAADRKVLKRDEAAVIEQITQAYVRAQGEISAALGNLENVCASATADAHRKGLAKAERDAVQRWHFAEVDRKALLKSMQPALAEIIADGITLLAKGIDREAVIARALEQLQGSLRDASWARLIVHPSLVEAAEAALNAFKRDTGIGRLARVVSDESLPEGGCVLESEFGRIDASLDTQLEVIRAAMADMVRVVAGSSAG
jgi:type III secretion protein L